MENRAEPNILEGPASIAKTELASNAETPEISPPMLDVHAPHEVLHTWKGFFIHIATIVVGLFIAVALEQSVEGFNRHQEVRALREDLRQESRQIIGARRRRWRNTTRRSNTHRIGDSSKKRVPRWQSKSLDWISR
jgi:hypothetical protein